MNVLIDIGNTRLKWQLQDGSQSGNFRGDDRFNTAWSALDSVERVIASSVGGKRINRAVEQWWQARGVAINWVNVEKEQCGVVNHYALDQLGVDRWVAAIGARRRYQYSACIIIDAGSAITVDGLTAAGEYLGGMIMPGYRLMARALHQDTDALKLNLQGVTDFEAFPVTTKAAIVSGIECAVSGGVAQAVAVQKQRLGEDTPCLMTGGDASRLNQRFSDEGVMAPALIFEGLQAIWESRQ